jgi:cell wall-associated NlpC family hydrolase
MKWLIGIVTVSVFFLTGCVTPTEKTDAQFVIAETVGASKKAVTTTTFSLVKSVLRGEANTNIPAPAMTPEVIKKQALLAKNAKKIKKAVKALLNSQKNRRTWYVFSGASPSGWDCSGLTMWTYQQIGVELPHRASEQGELGRKVNTKNGEKPKYGDLVVFHYKGYSSAYHVGIYLSKDKMIHAPMPGTATQKGSIKKWGGGYSDVSYVRILEN